MSNAGPKVLVVGGYGGFGRRLVELLEGLGLPMVWVAGRSREKAAAFCATRNGNLTPLQFDRAEAGGDLLEQLRPDILIDAAGPFQCYGERPYGLVETCLELGINYLDLADGREFVCGIAQFDRRARERGIFVLSGASSVPALSGAVVRELARGIGTPETVAIGITPAGGVQMGPNVFRAILSYAGRPVDVPADGVVKRAYTWTDVRAVRLEVAPGDALNTRWFSLCDVPDLEIWPRTYPGIRSVFFGAALEPRINHIGLLALAWLVRLRLVPGLGGLAPLLHRVSGWMPAGTRKGGMFVEISGRASDGDEQRMRWTLLADGDDGPYVPATAAACVVKMVQEGRAPGPGARSCEGDLDLAEFQPFFTSKRIRTSKGVGLPAGQR